MDIEAILNNRNNPFSDVFKEYVRGKSSKLFLSAIKLN